MENNKLDIAKMLLELKVTGMKIEKYQSKPQKFTKLPAITYSMINDNIDYAFKGIKRQNSIFQIDIWAETNSEISKILIELKKACLKNQIYYRGGNDIQDPSGIKRFICHVEINK